VGFGEEARAFLRVVPTHSPRKKKQRAAFVAARHCAFAEHLALANRRRER
jgi:hypothetical protein